jgi:hypothetical protein
MEEVTRREILHQTAAAGLLATIVNAQGDDSPRKPAMTDRQIVISCGMTEDEADCWVLTAKAAGKFFELPKLHPMDAQEVATAIHVIQNKLLSRPTYRKYLETAKKQGAKK